MSHYNLTAVRDTSWFFIVGNKNETKVFKKENIRKRVWTTVLEIIKKRKNYLMKKFSFYFSRDIERKWNIWNMSGKIREIRKCVQTLFRNFQRYRQLRKCKAGKKNDIKMYLRK